MTRPHIDIDPKRIISKHPRLAKLAAHLGESLGEAEAMKRVGKFVQSLLDGFAGGYVEHMAKTFERVLEARKRAAEAMDDVGSGHAAHISPDDFRKSLDKMAEDMAELAAPDPAKHAKHADTAELEKAAAEVVDSVENAPAASAPTRRGHAEAQARGLPLPGTDGFPPGHHWALVDGKLILRKNRGARGSKYTWDDAEKKFVLDAAGSWTTRGYDDAGKVEPCFPRNTLVKTPQGDRFIEDLRLGDLVYGWDFTNGMLVEQPVMGVLRNWTDHLVGVSVHGNALFSTAEHRFWNAGRLEWTHALDLQAGSMLWRKDGLPVLVESTSVQSATGLDTYNLDVFANTYFVGEAGYLVHNGRDPELSDWASKERRATTIYGIYDSSSGTAVLIYIGKTHQGEGDMWVRYRQHVADKPHWKARDLKGELAPRELEKGDWTDYETAVWEHHYIEANGGTYRRPGSKLENDKTPIVREKYDYYKDPKYGHDPCR